jgi:hypothetical protein
MAIVATASPNIAVPGFEKSGAAVEVTFSGSTDYVTNGVSPVAAILAATGWGTVDDIVLVAIGPTLVAGIFAASWDAANRKVKLYTDAAAECANALDISTIKMYFNVRGR